MSDKTRQDIERAEQAKRIVESPIFQEAISAVRDAVTKAWVESPLRDIDGQHELRLMIKAADEFAAYLRGAINDGKMAQIRLERAEKADKRRVK